MYARRLARANPLFFHKVKGKRDRMAKPGQTSAKKQPTLEMLVNLTGYLMSFLGKFSFEQIESFLKNKDLVAKRLKGVLLRMSDGYLEVRDEWEKFYSEHFGIEEDFFEVQIPPKPTTGSWRLIFIPQSLGLQNVIHQMEKHYKILFENTDIVGIQVLFTDTRSSQMTYAVWVQAGSVPDPQYWSKTTHEVDPNGISGVTLMERLIFEFKYFLTTGEHLDERSMTFCTGSRSADSIVCVRWNEFDGHLLVKSCLMTAAFHRCGIRKVVTN